MTQALSVLNATDFTPEQMKLITDVVARGATKDELALFLHRCKTMGLDPLKPGQIYFIKYGSGPGTIVVGIDGFRTKAQRTGQFGGIKRGVLRDAKGVCIGAFAEVYRKDWKEPAREEVPMNEYNTGKGNWSKMPETMIKKVAEAAALRMAFPDDLGGIYTQEEMEQADRRGIVAPEQPEPGDGVQTNEYVVPYGPCAKMPLSKCDPIVLRNFIVEREEAYKKSGREHGAWFIELLKNAEPYIAAFELREPGQDDNL